MYSIVPPEYADFRSVLRRLFGDLSNSSQ